MATWQLLDTLPTPCSCRDLAVTRLLQSPYVEPRKERVGLNADHSRVIEPFSLDVEAALKTHLAAARRGIVLTLLVTYLAGCTSWQAVGGVGGAARVRVTRLSGEQIELERPTLRGDTIVAGSVAIPRSEVELVEARYFSVGRSLLFLASIPVVAYGLLFLAYATCDDSCGNN